MRDGRRGQARLSAMFAPDGASACSKAVTDPPLPAVPRWTCRAGLAHGALLRDPAVAGEYAGGAPESRPSCH